MQPPEPTSEQTSLELPSESTAAPPPSTELDLPAADAPPMPVDSPAAEPAPGPLGNLLVAHFRRVEVAMLCRVLITTLGGALPPSRVQIERRRRGLSRRGGEPIGVSVLAGDRMLTLRSPEIGVTEASVSHVVRGIALSTEQVPVAEWLDMLGTALDQLTREDEATRTALERALLT